MLHGDSASGQALPGVYVGAVTFRPVQLRYYTSGVMAGTIEKKQAHELIERLRPEQVPAVVSLLQFMLLDPVSRAAAAAPVDDEPVTEEDRRRIREGRGWFAERGGQGIPMEDVLAEFGLTPKNFPLDK